MIQCNNLCYVFLCTATKVYKIILFMKLFHELQFAILTFFYILPCVICPFLMWKHKKYSNFFNSISFASVWYSLIQMCNDNNGKRANVEPISRSLHINPSGSWRHLEPQKILIIEAQMKISLLVSHYWNTL